VSVLLSVAVLSTTAHSSGLLIVHEHLFKPKILILEHTGSGTDHRDTASAH
jgi:hypothetical protein